MNIEVLCEHPNNANTYIVSKGSNVIIIDPANDVRSIKTIVKDRNVIAILLTHGHYDHFKEITKLLKEYDVPCYMHKNANLKLQNIDLSCARLFGCNVQTNIENIKFVSEGQKLTLEDFEIKCLYKPGHTDCSMVYMIEDSLFTGDVLFEDGIGRCDLPTGNMVVMMRSLKELKNLYKNKDYIVYPGHGDATTLYKEIKTNYYLLKN